MRIASMSDKSFVERVHDARVRFITRYRYDSSHLFLGPAEYHEFREWVTQSVLYARTDGKTTDEFAGMTIIGLMSDGLRVGITGE